MKRECQPSGTGVLGTRGCLYALNAVLIAWKRGGDL
jgi:hypothetical protein